MIAHSIRSCALLASLLLLPCGTAAAEPSAPTIYARTVAATAWVVVQLDGNRTSTGTAFVVDRDRRLLVTNHHVVGTSETVGVYFPERRGRRIIAERTHYQDHGRRVAGKVLDSDPCRDLALIEVEALPDATTSLSFADESPGPGEQIHAVGNPAASGALWVYHSGSVRQSYRKTVYYTDGQEVTSNVVETQSPINPGDSGGPVVADDGKLVGVVAAYHQRAQLVGTCIGIEEVRHFLADALAVLKPTSAAELTRRGERLRNRGLYDAAETAFSTALGTDAEYAPAFLGRGISRRLRGDSGAALADVERAVRLDPRSAVAVRERGLLHFQRQQLDRARADLGAAIRLDPTDALAHRLLGEVLFAAGQSPEALASFDRALTVQPRSAIAYFHRAVVRFRDGSFDRAMADLNQSLTCNPVYAAAYRKRGEVEKLLRHYEKAVADLTEAVRLNPRDGVAFTLRGEALVLNGRPDQALADFTQALALNPNSAQAYQQRAQAHRQLHEPDKAKADQDQAVRLDPTLRLSTPDEPKKTVDTTAGGS